MMRRQFDRKLLILARGTVAIPSGILSYFLTEILTFAGELSQVAMPHFSYPLDPLKDMKKVGGG